MHVSTHRGFRGRGGLIVAALALGVTLATNVTAASPLAATSLADNPKVRAQLDLFSAWVEGQIAIRGLPGIVAGVVSDQDLIWAKGFGHANVDADRPTWD